MQRRMIDVDCWLCQNTEMYSNGHSIYSVSKLSYCDLSTWRIWSFGTVEAYCSLLIKVTRTDEDIQLCTSLTKMNLNHSSWMYLSKLECRREYALFASWTPVRILNPVKELFKFYFLELSNALMINDAKTLAECHWYVWVH